MFCEKHGELLGFGGKCSICELDKLPKFRTEQKCIKCNISNFIIKQGDKISCSKCKEDYFIEEGTDNKLMITYTNVYELYKRNKFQLPIWAEERNSGEKIFLLEVREKRDLESNSIVPNGILVARFDKKGRKLPILENGARGKFRPIISNTGEYDNYITESHIGFLPSVEMDDWKRIDAPMKDPFDLNNLSAILHDEFNLFMAKYDNFNPVKRISARQKEFLRKLNFDGDLDAVNSDNVSNIIESLKSKRRQKRR